MGKVCSVKSCLSGRKRSKNKPPEPVSFFSPTTPAKLEKWNKALGIKMKKTDFICHLHFKEEDIRMYDTFYIKGEITILPKEKKTLREDAIPTIKHQFIPLLPHEIQARVLKNVHSNNQSENKCHHVKHEHEDQNDQELLHDHVVPDNFIHVIQLAECNLDTSQLKQETYDDIHDKDSDEKSLLVETFLKNVKSSPLPQGWFYFEKSDGVEFGQINPKTMQILKRIRVNKDLLLSITVILPTNEELNINDDIRSFHTIYDYLKSVERWPMCIGTQMDNNEFSKHCNSILIGDDSYKRNQPNPRCKSCRTLRHRLQRCNSKRKRRFYW